MMLGDFEVTVLSDGTTPRHVDEIMNKPDQIRKVLANAHQALPIELSINAFLINTGATLRVQSGLDQTAARAIAQAEVTHSKRVRFRADVAS
jgi:hypothetical protein